ncbi:MAG TPA: helix-turn-helix domain-containing protein [Gemmatimonadaceae bacterium]|nr:helix-turn-helix domain-containing protein [Gemmatimonadaceae bacterium]
MHSSVVTDSTDAGPAELPAAVLLVRSRTDRARLADALRGRARPVFVETVAELEHQVLRTVDPIVAVIAEPRDRDEVPTAPLLGRLRERRPGLSLVGYCGAGHEHSGDILDLASAGVHELMFRGLDESRHVLASVLARATHATAAESVLALVLPTVSENAAAYVSYCVHHAREDFDVEELASAFGLHRKTLIQRLREADLPTPSALIAWCRLFVVAHLLHAGGRAVDDIALALDFPSPGALRNLVKRYTGARPLELRARGGVRAVLAHFLSPDAFGRSAPPDEGQGAGGEVDSRGTPPGATPLRRIGDR